MRHPVHLVPLDLKARAMRAKDRARRMQKIALRVVADSLHDLILLGARFISVRLVRDPPLPSRVGRDLRRVPSQKPHRSRARNDSLCFFHLRRRNDRVHPLQIRHRPANKICRNLQPERIPRLQQHRLRLPQSLPHRAIRRLPEIASLGVLEVRLAGDDRDAKIGHGASRQNPRLHGFLQMRENKPLPVPREHILAAHGVQHDPAPRLAGLEQQVNLRIVPQGLIVPHALNGSHDCLLVDDISLVEADGQIKAVLDQLLQNLHLHRAHQLHADFPQLMVPEKMQLRVFFLESSKL